jgi:hypothetical protein
MKIGCTKILVVWKYSPSSSVAYSFSFYLYIPVGYFALTDLKKKNIKILSYLS